MPPESTGPAITDIATYAWLEWLQNASKTFPLFILVLGEIYHPLLCFNLFSVVEVYLSNETERSGRSSAPNKEPLLGHGTAEKTEYVFQEELL